MERNEIVCNEIRLIDRLFEAAVAANRNRRTRQELQAILDDPDSVPCSKVHDWRNHLPEAVVEAWHELPIEAKLAAYIPAELSARSEEWD